MFLDPIWIYKDLKSVCCRGHRDRIAFLTVLCSGFAAYHRSDASARQEITFNRGIDEILCGEHLAVLHPDGTYPPIFFFHRVFAFTKPGTPKNRDVVFVDPLLHHLLCHGGLIPPKLQLLCSFPDSFFQRLQPPVFCGHPFIEFERHTARSEERRVGKECFSPVRSRWSQ